jgi:hypothetical protein
VSREGAVEERVQHSGVDEGHRAKKGNGGNRRLLWRPGGTGGEEKGQGSGSGGTTWRSSAVGPSPDSRVASRPTAAHAGGALCSSRGGGWQVAGARARPAAGEGGRREARGTT